MKEHNIARQKQKTEWQQQRVKTSELFQAFFPSSPSFWLIKIFEISNSKSNHLIFSLGSFFFWQKLHLLWMAILQDRNRKLSDNNKGSEILASELFQAFFSFVSFFLATLALWKSPECRNGWPGFSSGKLPTTLSKAGGKRNVKNPAAQN